MKNGSFPAFLTILLVLILSFGLVLPTQMTELATVQAGGSPPPFPGAVFLHKATLANVTGNTTLMNNPLINGNPNAVLIVTQSWNPGGASSGVYNPTDVGVLYDAARGRWRIFNEDSTAMPLGAAFNVFVAAGDAAAGVHASTSTNTTYYWTNLNHPQANNNPNALLFTTHLYGAPGHTGETHNHALGVLYSAQNRWAVFNQDVATMSLDRDFNYLIAPEHPHIYVHTATAANTAGPASFLDHPALINNPYALVLVTPTFNPGGVGGTYYNHPVGIWYDLPGRRWCVFSEDIANIPLGSSYNIMIYASTTYFPLLRK